GGHHVAQRLMTNGLPFRSSSALTSPLSDWNSRPCGNGCSAEMMNKDEAISVAAALPVRARPIGSSALDLRRNSTSAIAAAASPMSGENPPCQMYNML